MISLKSGQYFGKLILTMQIEMRILSVTNSKDLALLQQCLEDAPAYWQRISGQGPKPEDGKNTFEAIPPGKSYSDKLVLGFFLGNEIIGIADLIRGYPNAETAMLGLLLIRERYQRQGLGTQSYGKIETFIQSG
jgi:RimJ/RimL family protein N-acetyltransferase